MKISTIADPPPQLVLEWMRRLRDGKLVEAHWVLFCLLRREVLRGWRIIGHFPSP
jgi:hypothetical protein